MSTPFDAALGEPAEPVTPSLRDRAMALCEAVMHDRYYSGQTYGLARDLKAALASEPALDRETLARTIALHVVTIGEGYDGRDCSCGALWPETDMGTLAEWRARHLAEVMLARLARGAAELKGTEEGVGTRETLRASRAETDVTSPGLAPSAPPPSAPSPDALAARLERIAKSLRYWNNASDAADVEAAARALREPSEEAVARELMRIRYASDDPTDLAICLEDVRLNRQAVNAARERARGMR
jgi:hypothetical protein